MAGTIERSLDLLLIVFIVLNSPSAEASSNTTISSSNNTLTFNTSAVENSTKTLFLTSSTTAATTVSSLSENATSPLALFPGKELELSSKPTDTNSSVEDGKSVVLDGSSYNTINKNLDNNGYDENGNHPKGCEAENYCGKDQWCSPSRNVCRQCSDLLEWCNNTALIHKDYSRCEQFCYEYMKKQKDRCDEQRENDTLEFRQKLQDTEWHLHNVSAERDQCFIEENVASVKLKEKDKEIGILQQTIDQMQRNISHLQVQSNQLQDERTQDAQHFQRQTEKLEQENKGLKGGLYVLLALLIIFIVAAVGVAFYIWKYKMQPPAPLFVEQNGEKDVLLRPTEAQGKQPVQAHRHSTHLTFENEGQQAEGPRDEYCFNPHGGIPHFAGDNAHGV